jgi:hypothetical protein
MGRIPHPAYSLGLPPSDLFLFGYIKRKGIDYNIPDWQNLKRAITHIFDEIGQETLTTLLERWINRPQLVIESEREYFHQ